MGWLSVPQMPTLALSGREDDYSRFVCHTIDYIPTVWKVLSGQGVCISRPYALSPLRSPVPPPG